MHSKKRSFRCKYFCTKVSSCIIYQIISLSIQPRETKKNWHDDTLNLEIMTNVFDMFSFLFNNSLEWITIYLQIMFGFIQGAIAWKTAKATVVCACAPGCVSLSVCHYEPLTVTEAIVLVGKSNSEQAVLPEVGLWCIIFFFILQS